MRETAKRKEADQCSLDDRKVSETPSASGKLIDRAARDHFAARRGTPPNTRGIAKGIVLGIGHRVDGAQRRCNRYFSVTLMSAGDEQAAVVREPSGNWLVGTFILYAR